MKQTKGYLIQRCAVFVQIFMGFSLALVVGLFFYEAALDFNHLLSPLCGLLWVGGVLAYWRMVHLPLNETQRQLRQFIQGYDSQEAVRLTHQLSPEVEAAFHKFGKLIIKPELINASIKQAEYLALQNQINPHFLYNTLEGVRGEALSSGMDSIAEMTEALATYFRYTISNVEKLVTLEDELENIENYYIIQQYRFGDRLSLSINIDAEEAPKVLGYRMPKLTLQPIIENSIYHGLEPKLGDGKLRIKVETTQNRLIITVSDNGTGFEEQHLSQLNKALGSVSLDYVKQDSQRRGGIAIINVNSRIKLLFGEEYGIYIYSTPGAGTDVEITLPIVVDHTVFK